MAARKKTGARCRTIGGVVYDLTATDRKAPCSRRASSPAPAAKPSSLPGAPAIKSLLLTVEPGPVGGYDLIASSRSGGGVAEVIGHYGGRDEAKRARALVEKTGELPKPTPQPFRKRDVRVTDLRVLERQERERAHTVREQREAFERAKAPKSTLASAGVLPKRAKPTAPALKWSERAALEKVKKSNAAGLLWHDGDPQSSIGAIVRDLANRGLLIKAAPFKYYLPEYSSEVARLLRNREAAPKPAREITRYADGSGHGPGGRLVRDSERAPKRTLDGPPTTRVSDYERRRLKKTPLPKSIDPSSARVGDRVSVFDYLGTEPEHATLTALPGAIEHGHVAKEPSVLFAPHSASGGMSRYIRWERMFPGWLDPNVNWAPWKG